MVNEAIATLDRFSGHEVKKGVSAAHEATARLWWDEPHLEEEMVQSWAYAPSGEAIACLARWRRGTGRSTDPSAVERAEAEAHDLTTELDSGLLPGKLVREVLSRTASTSPIG